MKRRSAVAMGKVVVLATGGTIASVNTGSTGAIASRSAAELMVGDGPQNTRVETRDVLNIGSYLMTFASMRAVAEAAHEELLRDDVDGVVITHGTDTLEETAALLDAVHASPKPIVLTGAQLPADHPSADGPGNLRQAVEVAASPIARRRGVLISFRGEIFAGIGTVKADTLAPQPFDSVSGGPLGRVGSDGVEFFAIAERPDALPMPAEAFDRVRVDVVVLYPGADASLCQAAESAGAQSVILLGTGSGNGNHAILTWLDGARDRGIVVALSTRVPRGPVVPLYGNGGGTDLIAAGAVRIESLPATQARILMALHLSAGREVTSESFRRGPRE